MKLWHDIATILWKEWREFGPRKSNPYVNWLSIGVMLALSGIVLPIQMGSLFVKHGELLVGFNLFYGVLMAMITAVDSFAGERERKTLETLLASRLPDKAILLGKMLFALLFMVALVACGCVLSLASVTIAQRQFPAAEPLVTLAFIIAGTGIAVLVISVAVLISVRATSLQHAMQTIGWMISIPCILLMFLMRYLIPLLDGSKHYDTASLVRIGLLLLLVLDFLAIEFVMSRFKRSRVFAGK